MQSLPSFRAQQGFVVRDHRDAPWILWASWPQWRFGKRCPELVFFRDFSPVHHFEVKDNTPRRGRGER